MSERIAPTSPEWVATGERILIVGHTGLVGSGLTKAISPYDAVSGLARGVTPSQNSIKEYAVDLRDKGKLLEAIEMEKPTVIIHAGGMTGVDECQKYLGPIRSQYLREDPVWNVNVVGVVNLANSIKDYRDKTGKEVVLGLFSSDYVLGNNGPFDEDAPRSLIETKKGNVISWYQWTKMQAEEALLSAHNLYNIPYFIARIALPYDPFFRRKPGTVVGMFERLAKGQSLALATDARLSFTPAAFIPNEINRLLLKKVWKEKRPMFHLVAPEIVSPVEVAEILMTELESRGVSVDRDKQFSLVTSEEFYEGRAPRPVMGGILPSLGVDMPTLSEMVTAFPLPECPAFAPGFF